MWATCQQKWPQAPGLSQPLPMRLKTLTSLANCLSPVDSNTERKSFPSCLSLFAATTFAHRLSSHVRKRVCHSSQCPSPQVNTRRGCRLPISGSSAPALSCKTNPWVQESLVIFLPSRDGHFHVFRQPVSRLRGTKCLPTHVNCSQFQYHHMPPSAGWTAARPCRQKGTHALPLGDWESPHGLGLAFDFLVSLGAGRKNWLQLLRFGFGTVGCDLGRGGGEVIPGLNPLCQPALHMMVESSYNALGLVCTMLSA